MQFKELSGSLSHQIYIESTGAASTTGNLPLWVAPHDCEITAVTILPSAAITADPTNYAIYTFTRHTAGAAAATVATRTWAATNSAALTEEAATLGAGVAVTAGMTVTAVKTVAASGLVIPALLVKIFYKLTGV